MDAIVCLLPRYQSRDIIYDSDFHFGVPSKNDQRTRDLMHVLNGEGSRATVPADHVQNLKRVHPERYSTPELFRSWFRVDSSPRLTMPRLEQLVINESVLALLALKPTPLSHATPTSVVALFAAMHLPHTVEESTRRLQDPAAGVAAHLWQWRKPVMLVLSKSSPFHELPNELKVRVIKFVLAPHFVPEA